MKSLQLQESHSGGKSPDIKLNWKALPWPGPTTAEIQVINATTSLTTTRTEHPDQKNPTLTFQLPAPAVAFIRMRPAGIPTAK